MEFAFAIVAVMILAAGVTTELAFRGRMRRFYDRRCAGSLWRDRFPDARIEEIRDFIQLFTSAFALPEKKLLSFAPDDEVWDIYRTIYPKNGSADALEYETLLRECIERYGVDICNGIAESTTLGDIFYRIRKTA